MPTLMLAVQKQPGTNVIAVVDGMKKQLPAIIAQMPAGIELEISFDRSKTIRDSVADVKFTLLLTIALVILVIFVFLQERFGNGDTEYCRSSLPHRNICVDGAAGIHRRQPVIDGDDTGCGLRRR